MNAAARRVLIVTRERLLGDLLSTVLAPRGYTCVLEDSTTSAFERSMAEPPSLTMVDLASLGQSGLDFIAELRFTDAAMPIIAVIGRGTSIVPSTVYGLGVTDIIRRDEDMREMLRVIDDVDAVISEDGKPRADAIDSPRAEPSIVGEPVTVLVVDDDEGVRKLLVRVLSRERYRVLTATDGVEALELLARETVHLMFLDVRMPRLGGVAVLQRLQDAPSRPRVVVISGLADRDLKLQTIQLGAFDYLEKPVTVDRLLVTASAALVFDSQRSASSWKQWVRRLR